MTKLSFEFISNTLETILKRVGFSDERAQQCARLFIEASRDGVHSHGLNRFSRFIQSIELGVVKVDAKPEFVASFGALERWDGCSGPGNLNAYASMERAIALAKTHGIGCVALRNTNHWMRAGNYGWQAADAGLIGICWTNTLPNLPPWGGTKATLGNNPLVLAVPRANGEHVVLDMAMSQFSFGALENYRRSNEQLPVIGGFDRDGELTRDPVRIEQSGRALPIGYWKGSGLSLLLDMIAALLANGEATYQITPDIVRETRLSQVFIAFAATAQNRDEILNGILSFMKSAAGDSTVRYPGERTIETRRRSIDEGITVDEAIWQDIEALARR